MVQGVTPLGGNDAAQIGASAAVADCVRILQPSGERGQLHVIQDSTAAKFIEAASALPDQDKASLGQQLKRLLEQDDVYFTQKAASRLASHLGPLTELGAKIWVPEMEPDNLAPQAALSQQGTSFEPKQGGRNNALQQLQNTLKSLRPAAQGAAEASRQDWEQTAGQLDKAKAAGFFAAQNQAQQILAEAQARYRAALQAFLAKAPPEAAARLLGLSPKDKIVADFGDAARVFELADQAACDAYQAKDTAEKAFGRAQAAVSDAKSALAAAESELAKDPGNPELQAKVAAAKARLADAQANLTRAEHDLNVASQRYNEAVTKRDVALTVLDELFQKYLLLKAGDDKEAARTYSSQGPGGRVNEDMYGGGDAAAYTPPPADVSAPAAGDPKLQQMCDYINEHNSGIPSRAKKLRANMPPKLIQAAYRATQMGLTITSSDEGRRGDGVHTSTSNHYSGNAIDVAGSPAAMARYTREMQQSGTKELFYDPVGGWKRGQAIGAIGGHSDHVHIAYA